MELTQGRVVDFVVAQEFGQGAESELTSCLSE
jgi:hypothetical protein